MLLAEPKAPGAWTFHLHRDRRHLATLALHRRRDEGIITVGEVPFALGGTRTRFVLLFEGVEVARAAQPSVLRRRLLLRVPGDMLDRRHARPGAAEARLELRAAHPFTRTFEMLEGDQRVGRIRPKHPFTRRTEITLPPYLQPAVQTFAFALALILWRRASKNS